MIKPFIQDDERVLNSTTDLLKTSVYAENLVKVIENAPKDKVFTIGVFGGWGTGKSSIIRTAQDEIEKKQRDVKFITYDAWKYANDSFRRMFLLKVQQDLKMRQTTEMSRFYQSETVEQEPRTMLSAKGLSIGIIAVAVVFALLWMTPLQLEWKVGVTTLGTLLSLVVTLLNGCFYDLRVSINKPALFAPEQFEACFKEMMSKCLKQKNWFKKTWSAIKDYVEVGEVSVVGLERLVIVIDNIDRCPSDLAYQMLTDIKTFLSNEKYNLVFIVPVDDEALKKHLFRKWNKADDIDINKEKEEFLRKFFNVTLRIKPHQETELLHFAHEINKESNLGFNNDTLSMVAKEFADNPRRIIQLLNNLSGDMALYEEAFAEKHETAICVALILREEYPSFYKETTKNLDLVRQFSGETLKEFNIKINESLMAFMRVANVILKQTPIETLQRIFTNTSSIFSDLPADIKRAVTTYDVTKVIDFTKNNEKQKDNVVDYALEKLNTEVKYGATTQTTMWIDFMCQLFKASVFDESRFSTIETALATHYSAAIPIIKDQDALNYMGSQMNALGMTSLRSAVIEYLNNEKNHEDTDFEKCLQSYLTHYTSERDCGDIVDVVANHYVDHIIDKNFTYTDNHIHYLFGDSFVGKKVENLSSFDDEDQIEDLIWCIKTNKELSGDTFSTLFAKFIDLFGETRGKDKEQYLDLINCLLPVFDVIETSKLADEPEQLYNLVIGTRGIPNPSRPTHPHYDTQLSILNEVDEDEAKVLTTFCYEIVRVSGGKIDISSAINTLFGKFKYVVIEGALKIHSIGIPLDTLSSILIQADDYSYDADISIIEILLTRKSDGRFAVSDGEVESKIHSLIDKVSIKNAENLIIRLVKDNHILSIVTEYVASQDSETINALPVTIAKYAVSTFNRNTSDVYKDNEDFLILVLKQGNAAQKKEVVRQMKTKINQEADLNMVVNVLDNLVTEDQSMLKLLIGELDGIKDSEAVNDETKSRIAALATKLSGYIKKPGMIDKLFRKK